MLPVYHYTRKVSEILGDIDRLKSHIKNDYKEIHLRKKQFDILYNAITKNVPTDKNRIPYADGFFLVRLDDAYERNS